MVTIERPIIIDNGTGYTKMGYAGNGEPSYMIPTAIATHSSLGQGNLAISRMQVDDLDYHIGFDAQRNAARYNLSNPIRDGQITNWDDMEKLWARSIYSHLHVEPENHPFVLTEPPMNTPENREQMAEIMFETFSVPGLYIGVQAVMSLFGAREAENIYDLSGTVIDSGDGVTHVLPVAYGVVINSCIKHIPLAGRDVTKYIMKLLQQRGEQIPTEDRMDIARQIKEEFCYVCRDPDEENQKFKSGNKNKTFEGAGMMTGTKVRCKVGAEMWQGPEMFFSPQKLTTDWDKPLQQVVDNCIQGSPIDVRRQLYNNILLTGGTTMFKKFKVRLKQGVQSIVDDRLAKFQEVHGVTPTPIKVNVETLPSQRYGVFYGASKFAAMPDFAYNMHTREKYLECGPSIARSNMAFSYN